MGWDVGDIGDTISNKVSNFGDWAALGVGGPLGLGIGHMIDATPGRGKNDYLMGGRKAYKEQQAYEEEQAAAAKQAAQLKALADQANAAYGIGNTNEAQANAARIRANRNATLANVYQSNADAADSTYSTGLTNNRIQMARSGTLGSGQDQQARSNLLAQRYANLSGAQQQASSAGDSLANTQLQQRLNLLQGIRGGQITDTTGVRNEIAGYRNSGSLGTQATNLAGGILQTMPNMYSSYKLAQAYKGAT